MIPPPGNSGSLRVPDRVPDATVRRLSLYHRHLEELGRARVGDVASRILAERAGTAAAQVRKDLSYLGSFGKRGLGYDVSELTAVLRRFLGLDSTWRVALLGAGRIGTALFAYQPFRERGFEITAVIDNDPAKVGKRLGGEPHGGGPRGGVTIVSEAELESTLRSEGTDLAIVAVPAQAAQSIVDRVVEVGVGAVLNFAPVLLRVPEGVAIRNVSMLVEMESLSHSLVHRPPPTTQRPR